MMYFIHVTVHFVVVIGYCFCQFRLQTLDEHTGVVGGSVTLQCTYKNPPLNYTGPVVILWNRPRDDPVPDVRVISYHSGTGTTIIGGLYENRVRLTGHGASINITGLSFNDIDKYRCSVDYLLLLDGATVETQLTVVGNRQFELETKAKHTGVEGGSVTLQCTYKYPPQSYSGPMITVWNRPRQDQDPDVNVISYHSGTNTTTIGGLYKDRAIFQGNDATITITELSFNDSDVYRCSVNFVFQLLSAMIETQLKVMVPLKSNPIINDVQHGGTVTVTNGEQTSFACKVFGTYPAATFQWTVNGIAQTSSNESTTTTSNGLIDTISTITYTPQWKYDQGQIVTCKATNLVTTMEYSASVHMDLIVPPTGVAIKDYANGADCTVNEGRATEMICTSTAKPAPSLIWFIDDVRKKADNKTQRPNEDDDQLFDGASVLSFTPNWSDHMKWVKCVANGNVFSKVKLDVRVPVKFVLISNDNNNDGYKINDNITVVDNHEYTLTCETRGTKPAAIIDWNTDLTQVHLGATAPSLNSTDVRLFDTTRKITFTPRWSNHGSAIFCNAENLANINKVSKYVQLDVQVVPSIDISRKSPTGHLDAMDGRPTTVACNAIGSRPESSIKWTFGGRLISDTESVTDNLQDKRLKDTESIISLTPSYELNQNETLMCEASSQATDKISTSVIDRVTMNIFVSYNQLTFVTFNNGDNITLTAGTPTTVVCKAHKSHPATSIRWYFAEDDVSDNATEAITWNSDGRKDTISSLVLTTGQDDFGKHLYCKGIHAAQTNPVKLALVGLVQYRSEIKNQGQDISTADAGQTATLTCIASGFPIPEVKWYITVSDVVTEIDNHFERIAVAQERNHTARYIKSYLFIANVQPAQDYKLYMCRAVNNIGISTHNITLTKREREPEAATEIIVIATNWENITVVWKAGKDGGSPQHFIAFYRKSGSDLVVMSDRILGNHYTLTDLEPETTYCINITARNDIGWSEPSETVVVSTSVLPKPSTNQPGQQKNNAVVIGSLTAVILLVVGLVIMLPLLLWKGKIGRKVYKRDEVELDNVKSDNIREGDERLQATYEEIPFDTNKRTSCQGVKNRIGDMKNDKYMDLVPANNSEGIYTKPDKERDEDAKEAHKSVLDNKI